uniref:VOC domain-containing protein n=1 Tax=Odontella aurita TaxID=265563 RepID=A0A6U6K0L1_9STRA
MASRIASSGVRFGRAILMARGAEGVASAVNFYQNGLGLAVVRHTDDWAELACGVAASADGEVPSAGGGAGGGSAAFRLSIKAVESEAHLSVGYGPFLSFDVDDMDGAVARCVQLGGKLDGPIQYPAHGKVAALRAPDGNMISLYEPAI